MIEILISPEKNLQIDLKKEIIQMLNLIWPDSPCHDNQLHPKSMNAICVVLLAEKKVCAYAGIVSAQFKHKGESYKACGLSCVSTSLLYRNKGLGSQLIEICKNIIIKGNLDISIFTCSPSLAPFYCKSGWEIAVGSEFIGGSKEKPFHSSDFGAVTLIMPLSVKAKKNKNDFIDSKIFIDLGEKEMW